METQLEKEIKQGQKDFLDRLREIDEREPGPSGTAASGTRVSAETTRGLLKNEKCLRVVRKELKWVKQITRKDELGENPRVQFLRIRVVKNVRSNF